MKHVRSIIKAFVLICSLVTTVLLTFVCFSPEKTSEYLLLESSGIEVEDTYETTIPFERAINVTIPGEPPTTYECEMTTSEDKGEYLYRAEQEEQTRRRALLNKVCADRKIQAAKLERRHFLLDHKHRLLYCWIHKVASTSWIAFMANLRGLRVRPKKVYREINKLAAASAQEVESVATDYRFRFIVVRHPFRRLISAYRDRIWAATNKFSAQAWTHAPRILRLTRPSLIHLSSVSVLSSQNKTLIIVPTFKEFVQYLIIVASTEQSKEVLPEGKAEATTQDPPSIQSNLSTFDAHWVPYHHHCSVCSIPYNMIIKLETIEKDKKYFMEEMNAVTKRSNNVEGEVNLKNNMVNRNESRNERKMKLTKALKYKKRWKRAEGDEENKNNGPTKCINDQDKDCLQVTPDFTISDFNLHHLQVSNVGPSCPCYYFSQLSKAQIDSLKEIYETDLNMFGYDTKEYEKCIKKDK